MLRNAYLHGRPHVLASQAAISLENAGLLDEMKRAEHALRESEEKLAGIVDSVVDYMLMIDEQFNVVWVNDIAGELFGSDVVGQKCHAVFHRQDKPCEICGASQCFEDAGVHKVEVEAIGADGKQRTFLSTFSVAARQEDGRPKSVLELFHDITDRKQAEDKIKASLKEKEVLLKEIHHRVKNNLQVISSLLNLQLGYVKDKHSIEVFEESRNRVRSMALVHEKLYQSENLSMINFAEYIRSLTSSLFRSYGASSSAIALKIHTGDVLLSIDTAIPCGLIINELISNSLKHAFPAGRGGEIRINLHSDNGTLTLIISDNGIGFSKDLDFRNTKTLGLQLVIDLVGQLNGTIELDRSGGTEFKITTISNHI